MSNVSLIVMEQNSEWPSGNTGDWASIVAIGHEKEGLLQRTREQLSSLRRQGHSLRVAMLACNEATDVTSVSRRAEVAHELLAAVSTVEFGCLYLTATDSASAETRRELLSLADALSQRLRGLSATVLVSLRFGAALPPSIRLQHDHRTFRRMLAILDARGYPTAEDAGRRDAAAQSP
jgi:hypothetical protein